MVMRSWLAVLVLQVGILFSASGCFAAKSSSEGDVEEYIELNLTPKEVLAENLGLWRSRTRLTALFAVMSIGLGSGGFAYGALKLSNQSLDCAGGRSMWQIPFCYTDENATEICPLSRGNCPSGSFLALSEAVAQRALPTTTPQYFQFSSLVSPKDAVIPLNTFGSQWDNTPVLCYGTNLTADDLSVRYSSSGSVPPFNAPDPVVQSFGRYHFPGWIRDGVMYGGFVFSGLWAGGAVISGLISRHLTKKLLLENDGHVDS